MHAHVLILINSRGVTHNNFLMCMWYVTNIYNTTGSGSKDIYRRYV